MARENEFEPRPGRLRTAGGKRGRKYLSRVIAATTLVGPRRAATGFQGNRIGRGCGIGRVLASRDRAARARRVVIKSRIVRLAGRGGEGARIHLRYLQRDGVTREGLPGTLYGASDDAVDGKAFHERARSDRHQFRMIVSAEDGAHYEDLRPLTRRLMARMEEDLGTRLDWLAVDHFNTGHPHSHIVLRGVDERGRDLVIARDYMARGMRARAEELVEIDLGPRSDREIAAARAVEIEAERWTGLDRELVAAADTDRLVAPRARDPVHRARLAGRLAKLARLGLAEPAAAGRWRLGEKLEATLRQLGLRGDMVKALNQELVRCGAARAAAELAIFETGSGGQAAIVGRIVASGLADELSDRHYLIVDALDGRAHYVDIGARDALEPMTVGMIVRVAAKAAKARPADRLIVEVAAANGGHYDAGRHLRHDRAASPAFAEAHVRRLDALRRAGLGLVRAPDGVWQISGDHLQRVEELEQARRARAPVSVEILSRLPLAGLSYHEGDTWLDRQLVSDRPEPLRAAGFGREIGTAIRLRRQWLIGEELAHVEAGRFVAAPDLLDRLRARALARAAAGLAAELRLAYTPLARGHAVAGRYRRAVDLAGGRFAVIERSRDFTLVPWRPVLERARGHPVSGRWRGGEISWSIGRERGPSI